MAYRVAGSNVAPRVAGGGRPPPRLGPSSGMPGIGTRQQRNMNFGDVAGTMRPGSPQYDAIAQHVLAQFGSLADVPEDTPLGAFLKMSGFADATPGLFPEREQRRTLRRGGLSTAAGLNAGNSGGLNLPDVGGGSGNMPATPGGGGGGGGGGLPSRVSADRLFSMAAKGPPPRLGPAGAAPGRIGAGADVRPIMDAPPERPALPMRMGPNDALMAKYRQFLEQRRMV